MLIILHLTSITVGKRKRYILITPWNIYVDCSQQYSTHCGITNFLLFFFSSSSSSPPSPSPNCRRRHSSAGKLIEKDFVFFLSVDQLIHNCSDRSICFRFAVPRFHSRTARAHQRYVNAKKEN